MVDMLEEPIVLAVMIIGIWWGYDHLEFSERIQTFATKTFSILVAINLTWLVVRLVDAIIVEYLIPLAQRKAESTAEQFGSIIRKSIRTILWILGIIIALSNAGYNVGALLAGVGIGGIAMAMAAKDFVANMFGGVTVFIDKPFVVGDRIQIDGFDGTVVEIGIRSTRLKTLAGRIVTVPNHKFTDSYVENVTLEPTRKMTATFGLTYDTNADRIEEAIALVREIVLREPDVLDDAHAWFSGFGDFSLNVSLIYYVRKEGDLFEVPNRINLSVLREFEAKGLEFAFPTQTIYHKPLD
ncbi:MAG: mechanosensitive ion channel family protein [Flavobacteriales bacterium]